MTTETLLTKDQIIALSRMDEAIPDTVPDWQDKRRALVGRAIEQAVLQSPEVQRLREDAARLDFMISDECQIQSLTLANGTKFRLGWPDDGEAQSEWFANSRAAIDAAMEKKL